MTPSHSTKHSFHLFDTCALVCTCACILPTDHGIECGGGGVTDNIGIKTVDLVYDSAWRLSGNSVVVVLFPQSVGRGGRKKIETTTIDRQTGAALSTRAAPATRLDIMSYYKDRLGFDPDEPTANGDGTGTTTSSRKSKRGYEENLSKFKGLSHTYCLTIQSRAVYVAAAYFCSFWRRSKTRSTVNASAAGWSVDRSSVPVAAVRDRFLCAAVVRATHFFTARAYRTRSRPRSVGENHRTGGWVETHLSHGHDPRCKTRTTCSTCDPSVPPSQWSVS
ncbi:hypothetical protein AGLY_004213 [Aphis glycines]|uniref:Uncharacterized protein n=1 Tax=Aphis glycines TaxID=307491 RepID=A0A6G0TXU4_APHGL|nr:hypothetical protein AGLY_004213 [Aphis glycines]